MTVRVLSIVAVLLVVLSALALEDITTGSEPSLRAEYLMLAVTSVYLTAFGIFLKRRRATATAK